MNRNGACLFVLKAEQLTCSGSLILPAAALSGPDYASLMCLGARNEFQDRDSVEYP